MRNGSTTRFAGTTRRVYRVIYLWQNERHVADSTFSRADAVAIHRQLVADKRCAWIEAS